MSDDLDAAMADLAGAVEGALEAGLTPGTPEFADHLRKGDLDDDAADLLDAVTAADEDGLTGEDRAVFVEAFIEERARMAKAAADRAPADEAEFAAWLKRHPVEYRKAAEGALAGLDDPADPDAQQDAEDTARQKLWAQWQRDRRSPGSVRKGDVGRVSTAESLAGEAKRLMATEGLPHEQAFHKAAQALADEDRRSGYVVSTDVLDVLATESAKTADALRSPALTALAVEGFRDLVRKITRDEKCSPVEAYQRAAQRDPDLAALAAQSMIK